MRKTETLLVDINGGFAQSFLAFQDINNATRELMSDDEAYLDQLYWFEPKLKVKNWVESVKLQRGRAM